MLVTVQEQIAADYSVLRRSLKSICHGTTEFSSSPVAATCHGAAGSLAIRALMGDQYHGLAKLFCADYRLMDFVELAALPAFAAPFGSFRA